VYVLSDLTGPFPDVYAAVPRLKAHLAGRSDSDSYLADRIGANTKVCCTASRTSGVGMRNDLCRIEC